MTASNIALLPCPFCGGKAEIERPGTARQSCIIACADCGCRLETGEVWSMGERWNRRHPLTSTEPQRVPDDEIDYDDPKFNQGVQHVVDLLSKTLGAEGWVAGDGSEDYDCDLEQTLFNILAAKGLYDKDEGEFASLAVSRPQEK